MMREARIPLKGDGSLVVKTLAVETKELEAGSILALVSTDSIDSDMDIIHQGKTDEGEGWSLDRFNKHPVMLWAHDPYRPSLGGGKAFVGSSDLGKGLHLVPKFDSGDPFAMELEGKIRRKVIQETSVGFTSSNFSKRKDQDDDPWTGYDFWDSELQEVSWVNRGANPDVDMAVKGMIMRHPDLLKQIDDFDDRFLGMIKGELIDRFDEMHSRIKTLEDYIAASKSDAMNGVVKDLISQFDQVLK
jgi:HK97 family phage prohead protease